MGFWGDGVYRYDQIEVRDQSDRAWDIAFIIPTSIKPSTSVILYFLIRNNDLLSNIDDDTKYPNALIHASYLRIYENANRIPLLEMAMDSTSIERIADGIYKYVWAAPAFTTDAFSIEVTLETEYINPATTNYPIETIIVDRTFDFSLGGQGGGGGVTPVGTEIVSIFVRDRATHDPIADARFYLYDVTNTNMIGFGKTNTSGKVTLTGNVDAGLTLDPGTYNVRLIKILVNFTPSYMIAVVVGGLNIFILEGTVLTIGPPSGPDKCLIYGDLADFGIVPDPNDRIVVVTANLPRVSGDWILTGKKQIYHSNALGHFQFEVGQGIMFKIDIPEAGVSYIFTAPFQSVLDLKTLIEPKVPD